MGWSDMVILYHRSKAGSAYQCVCMCVPVRACSPSVPVAMDMRGAEGKAVVQQGGVDHGPVLRPLQEVA